MAEMVFKDIVNKNNLSDKFYIDSAATCSETTGDEMYYETRNTLLKDNIPFTNHTARKLKIEDYEKYDFIIGMDNSNIRNIKRIIGKDNKKINIIYVTRGEILKTPTGKIKRKEEIEKVRLYSYKQTSNLKDVIDNDIAKSVKEILSKQLGIDVQQIKEDSNIYDLGADSLDKVEIILAVEKVFDIKVPKEVSTKMNTVKDILDYKNSI